MKREGRKAVAYFITADVSSIGAGFEGGPQLVARLGSRG